MYGFRQDTPDLPKQACGWYRTCGQNLRSEFVDPTTLLKSRAMQEDRVIRWYFLVAGTYFSLAFPPPPLYPTPPDSLVTDHCNCSLIYLLRQAQRCLDKRE